MTSEEGGSTRCKNCDTELQGPFCHQCGQEDQDFDVPFWGLAKTAVDDLFGLDTRFWRTLRPLLSRPGFLTREYFAGRLTPYVPPFKLFIFISALFFITLALTQSTIVHQTVDSDGKPVAKSGLQITVKPDEIETSTEEPTPTSSAAEREEEDLPPWFVRNLKKIEKLAIENPTLLNRSMRDRLSQILIVLVPLFALFLRLLYRRQLKHYQHHLIFSLHVHSAVFLALTIALPIDRLLGFTSDGPLNSIAELGALFYLYLALRRVYGEGRWRTLLKLVVLLGAHMMSGIFVLFSALALVLISA